MHRHEPSEIYHVTGGQFSFYVSDPDSSVRRVVAGRGDVVPLRRGTPHT